MSAAKLVQESVDVVELRRSVCVVFGLGFADLGQEQLAAEEAQLALVALKSIRADDVRRRLRALKDDRRLIGSLDVVDDIRDVFAEIRDRYSLHYDLSYR